MDAFGAAPFDALPHDHDQAVAKFGSRHGAEERAAAVARRRDVRQAGQGVRRRQGGSRLRARQRQVPERRDGALHRRRARPVPRGDELRRAADEPGRAALALRGRDVRALSHAAEDRAGANHHRARRRASSCSTRSSSAPASSRRSSTPIATPSARATSTTAPTTRRSSDACGRRWSAACRKRSPRTAAVITKAWEEGGKPSMADTPRPERRRRPTAPAARRRHSRDTGCHRPRWPRRSRPRTHERVIAIADSSMRGRVCGCATRTLPRGFARSLATSGAARAPARPLHFVGPASGCLRPLEP